jgi:hypothetical protein
MQIIDYDINKNTVLCGFKENNYVVYSQTTMVDGYTKNDYIQKMYEEAKSAIDYERNLFENGKENSILTDKTGFEWQPEEPKPDRIEISTSVGKIYLTEGSEIDIDVSYNVYSQYGDIIDVDVNLNSSYGYFADGVLTIPYGAVEKIEITGEVDGISDTKIIEVTVESLYSIQEHKENLIHKTKDALQSFLESNPLTFIDGKEYSVTKDKQNLLNNAIAVYQMKVQAGMTAEIKWNASGEECTVWAIEDVITLALSIAGYVEPLVSKQQALEVAIKNCTTPEELENIVIDYATV